MVVASLLYAVCLYRAYGALDTLSPYIYYELLVILCSKLTYSLRLRCSLHLTMAHSFRSFTAKGGDDKE